MTFNFQNLFLSVLAFCMLAVLSIATYDNTANKTEVQRLSTEIYYEALCPSSIILIRYRLYDAMLEQNLLPYTDLTLIPFGKASFYNDTTINKTKITCQHGEQECELNAWHGCIIEQNGIEEQLKLIKCMLSSKQNIIDACGKRLQLDVSAVRNCKQTRDIVDILRKYGDKTKKLDITSIPTIVFDHNFKPFDQQHIFDYFERVFCQEYQKKYNVKLDNCLIFLK